jgi:hypothetical protein
VTEPRRDRPWWPWAVSALFAALCLWLWVTRPEPVATQPPPPSPAVSEVLPPPAVLAAPETPDAGPAAAPRDPRQAPSIFAAAEPESPSWFGFCDLKASNVRMPVEEAKRRRAMLAALDRSWPEISTRPIERVTAELEQRRTESKDVAEVDLATLQLARLLAETSQLTRARAVFADHLRRFPNDRSNAQLAARIDTQLEIQAGYGTLQNRGITISYDRATTSDSRALELADEVRRALDEAAQLTRTRSRDTLNVVVYPSRSELLASTCVPDWSGGVFDGTLRLVAKSATSMTRVVRHESMHAQVEPQMLTAPRWFSEGLARYFEKPQASLDVPVAAAVLKGETILPFAQLSSIFHGEDSKLAGKAYLQSEAMVRWLVSVGGPLAIADEVRGFREGRNDDPLTDRGLTQQGFEAWLQQQK